MNVSMDRFVIPLVVILSAGCSLPPTPPMVDGTSRQLINDVEEIEKQFNVETIKMESIPPQSKSEVFHIYFPFNSAKIKLNADKLMSLNSWIKKAQHIEIRARTDNQNPSVGDEKIALKRALAVQGYLIDKGVLPGSISINYLSAGDYIANNTSKKGKAQNRRVDVIIFVS